MLHYNLENMRRIILIDDDSFTLDKYKEGFPFSEHGFIVDGLFTNSKSALDYMETHPVDAVITDIRMPEPDGLEFADICMKKHPSIKIILLSAYADFEYAQKAIKLNVFRYITKPVDYDELNATLKDLSECICETCASSFPEKKIFIERYKVFSNLLCGIILDEKQLIKSLESINISAGVIKNPCAIININLPDYDNYMATDWKHGKDKFYNAVGYLAPTDNDNAYYACTRYFMGNIEWIIMAKANVQNISTLVGEFTHTLVGNFRDILHLDANVTFVEKHNRASDLLRKSYCLPIDQSQKDVAILLACEYMKKNLGASIRLDDIAHHVSISPNYLSLRFKQVTGKRLIDYLIDLRMEKAASLLLNTSVKISAICDMVGYQNATHFYNIFKQHYNETPAQYRKKRR